MTLNDIRSLLGEHSIQLTKSLGQCFLHDEGVVEKIANLGEAGEGDRILEVGPGLGPLTEVLLARGAKVMAVELDQRLVEVLKGRFAGQENLELIHDDAMVRVVELVPNWNGWKMVANLPYSIGSPLLVELARPGFGPDSMAVTLQKEVVDRMKAPSGRKSYGVLTVLLNVSYEVGDSFVIPPGCFFPEPAIDSACVRLVRRAEPLVSPELFPLFRRLVKLGFSQRRKMMMKLLKQDWPADVLSGAFEAVGLDERIRAEAVPVETFVKMAEYLAERKAAR